MARLREVPHVIRAIGFFEFLKRVWKQVGEDDVFTWAASLAYSWMFAIFPFLIFLLSLVPLMPERTRAQAGSAIEGALKQLPQTAAQPLQAQADDLLHHPRGKLLSVGLLITIWAASGGMSMTMTALDRCYDIRDGRTYIKQRSIAIILTIVAATLIILVTILLPIASAVLDWLQNHGHLPWLIKLAFDFSRFFLAILLMIGVLALVYHFGPSIKQKFHVITPGAVFSLTVWLILAFVFRYYINRFGEKSYNATYGAVAGVAILLLFFYIDATVLLIGAEINSEVDFVILGLPSSDDAPAVAPPIEHTDAHKVLKEDLEARRGC